MVLKKVGETRGAADAEPTPTIARTGNTLRDGRSHGAASSSFRRVLNHHLIVVLRERNGGACRREARSAPSPVPQHSQVQNRPCRDKGDQSCWESQVLRPKSQDLPPYPFPNYTQHFSGARDALLVLFQRDVPRTASLPGSRERGSLVSRLGHFLAVPRNFFLDERRIQVPQVPP